MNLRIRHLAASFSIALAILAISGPAWAVESPAEKSIAITGTPSPDLKPLDEEITALMRKWSVPGGALGVVIDGRLVFAHGYGLADREAGAAVQPDSLFRIASITKPITAAAILVLMDRGQLDLDAKVLDVLKLPSAATEKIVDPRWKQITIRQLLFHTAGFDRSGGFDPMFRSYEIAKATGTPAPAKAGAIIRFMLGRRLDFDPGTKHAYSNFGYLLLGRVIEKVTGKSYAEAVQNLVLQPAGVTRMKTGHTRLSERLPGEVRYYTPDNELARSVFPDVRERVPWPYGGFYLEAMDSHGAWVASSIDLLRFFTALDGTRKPGLLKAATVRLIESRPPAPLPAKSAYYYGLGWSFRPVGQGLKWSHDGSLPGTMTLLVRTPHGVKWAALFNLRPEDDGQFLHDLNNAMSKGISRVPKWPKEDLFTKY